MALFHLLLESGDRLLMEDGSGFLTEDSVDERTGLLTAPIGEIGAAASGALDLAGAMTVSIGEIVIEAIGSLGLTNTGVLACSIGSIACGASGALAIDGTLAASIGTIGITAVGTGAETRDGTLAASIGDILLTATAVLGAAPSGPITLDEARRQCRLDDGSEDDALLLYMAAAIDWVTEQTGCDPAVVAWPPLLKLAALLLIGEFYGAREVGTISPEAERIALSLIRSKRPLTA